jgi:hypothetical protein
MGVMSFMKYAPNKQLATTASAIPCRQSLLALPATTSPKPSLPYVTGLPLLGYHRSGDWSVCGTEKHALTTKPPVVQRYQYVGPHSFGPDNYEAVDALFVYSFGTFPMQKFMQI